MVVVMDIAIAADMDKAMPVFMDIVTAVGMLHYREIDHRAAIPTPLVNST